MEQLKVKDILAFLNQINKQGIPMNEIAEMPIYLGNDDELNGIHCGWYTNLVDTDKTDDEDNMYTIGLIEEYLWNTKLSGKAILIS